MEAGLPEPVPAVKPRRGRERSRNTTLPSKAPQASRRRLKGSLRRSVVKRAKGATDGLMTGRRGERRGDERIRDDAEGFIAVPPRREESASSGTLQCERARCYRRTPFAKASSQFLSQFFRQVASTVS